MKTELLGEQIAKYRKAAGLTQEELGRAVGVSTQAVSRWECGGAPDVTLLPAIADRLHVTVDALFGRESGPAKDISNDLIQWLRSIPEKERICGLARLLWEAAIYGVCDDLGFNIPSIGFPENAEADMPVAGANRVLLRTVTADENGYIVGVGAEDYAYFGVFPEPEAGYERYFASDDEYRRLFGALALPGAMETLRFYCRNKEALYSAAAVAQRMGAPLPETERALQALTEANLLHREQITLPEGPLDVYVLGDYSGVVPLLTFARWNLQPYRMNLIGNVVRQTCFGKGDARDEKR